MQKTYVTLNFLNIISYTRPIIYSSNPAILSVWCTSEPAGGFLKQTAEPLPAF